MKTLLAAYCAVSLLSACHNADSPAAAWCYHEPTCSDSAWPKIVPSFCNGTRQSPIDIVTANVEADANLTAFTFKGFDGNSALTKIRNTGNTIRVDFAPGHMNVSGGALPTNYTSLQFHLHWGNGSYSLGSEHSVNGKRYPMELHIVTAKSIYHGNTTRILADSEGLAALGFFIEATTEKNQPESWKALTSYLTTITQKGGYANITHNFSMADLLPGVDMTKYYRYHGSLTTPTCNEAVIWTVFKDPVKVSQNLIDLFSMTVRINDSTSMHMTNVYRSLQPINTRVVKTQTEDQSASEVLKPLFSLTLGTAFFQMLLYTT
ncbi:carbonic anhydrase 4-like [Denticeps clupeoides]|nr:carbonic anhydrase 4-like [Denticeps clupeoides]